VVPTTSAPVTNGSGYVLLLAQNGWHEAMHLRGLVGAQAESGFL
jgi:hypothetical protein